MFVKETKCLIRWKKQRIFLRSLSALPKKHLPDSVCTQSYISSKDEKLILALKKVSTPEAAFELNEKQMKVEKQVNRLITLSKFQGLYKPGIQSALKNKMKLNEIKCTFTFILRNSVVHNPLSVIFRGFSKQAATVSSSRHYSQQSDSGADMSSVGTQQSEETDIESWEMLVDYDKLTSTEKKIHERHRNAVKKQQFMYVCT
ncbi:uncharacterized protein LOC128548756 [Mercenaria mercenaria]|uniref:uncharacterized protein LOC128548756 n=1 Tax=Mercenaria mercenaria TaxID=6596 RepID=UPI00234E631E|nr:uncharacterized protein LOC128548756 [Mercenaria mercenaria]